MYHDCIATLHQAGFTLPDAQALRRISMTLHRWHEAECGNSEGMRAWCLVRGYKALGQFTHDDDGAPFMERHFYYPYRTATCYDPLPDRERGALKRLAKIMARYPGFQAYVQTDPRGCALYILRPGDHEGRDVSSCYTRGIAVYR